MKRVLVTGMSGTGKSTVINELAARGYKAVDTDDHGLSEWVAVRLDEPTGLGPGQDWVWREDRIQDLLSADDADVLFLSGCSPNQGKFYPQFDHIVLAAASLTLSRPLFVAHNDALSAADRIGWFLGHLPAFAFVTVGAVVVSRRPGNVIGWLCCGIGLAQILAGFGGSSARSVLAADPSYGPGWVVLYSLGELCWELSWALLALLLLVFPTGRLPSRRWRPVAWAAGGVGGRCRARLGGIVESVVAWPTGRWPAAQPDRVPSVGGRAPAGL
jgi:hypothetical protein